MKCDCGMRMSGEINRGEFGMQRSKIVRAMKSVNKSSDRLIHDVCGNYVISRETAIN